MLRELHISNLAVISDVRIELAGGLNCFTGATGAGKSLVIGAIEVLLGMRSPAEMLRPGADEGRVSGVFEVRNKTLLEVIDEYGNLDALREQYHAAYSKVVDAKQRMHDLSTSKALREQQLELYRFQADEIDTAELDAAEFDELAARSTVLSNLEKLKTDAGAAHTTLYEADG